MGEVIRFIPRSELERARLIRKSRAKYDRVFPPADPVSEQRDATSVSQIVSGTNAYHIDGDLLSRSKSSPCTAVSRFRQIAASRSDHLGFRWRLYAVLPGAPRFLEAPRTL